VTDQKLSFPAPCGHGELVRFEPLPPSGPGPASLGYPSKSNDRWGVVAVVRRRDGEVKPCCSRQEGEFATREEALKECLHLARWHQQKLTDALVAIDAARYQVAQAGLSLEEALAFDHWRRELRFEGSVECHDPLCFERGEHWIMDENGDEFLVCTKHRDWHEEVAPPGGLNENTSYTRNAGSCVGGELP